MQAVAAHKQLGLTIEVDKAVPTYLKGLRQYLDHALLKLISNALKFTNEGWVID